MYSEAKADSSSDRAQNNESGGLVIGIIFSIITFITVLSVYFWRDKIFVAIAMIKEGSK